METTKPPIIGVVARLVDWKGVQYTIEAYRKFLKSHKSACLILASGGGRIEPQIQEKLTKLPSDSYRIIFEHNFAPLYKTFDYLVHVPITPKLECFGLVYLEALAAKVPCIFTMSGVANEFIEDGKHALVVDFQSTEAIYHAMSKLASDDSLCKRLSTQGYEEVYKRYQYEDMINNMVSFYKRISNESKREELGL